MLKQQHDDLDRLEAEDAALDDAKIAVEADKILRKPDTISFAASTLRKAKMGRTKLDDPFDLRLPTPKVEDDSGPSQLRPESSASADDAAPLGSPSSVTPPASAVETNFRYHKARVSQIQKQLDNSEQLRSKLNEQVKSLERELKSEREEGKKLRKQVQLLEADQRRSARKGPNAAVASANDPQALQQEVASLKKDLQTAERLAKQAEAASKAKETQLKRATETIARMKNQMNELVDKGTGEEKSDRSRAETAEARVKVLEKQRADLISAFKKQMKLIDILKRQKVHIEAARLLSFTEEEFIKTLDWSL